jgi:uncharacterized protein (TIGR00297 family)
LIAIISFRVKFLTAGGSIATFILAGLIFSLGGVKWSIPILTFFIISSILSKLRKRKNAGVELFFEKSGVRDQYQVLANGGIGGVLVIANFIYPYELFYLIYLSSLSAVCADTWATEIGTWKRTTTFSILNFRSVEQGVSGGISVIGTLGALMGTIAIALSGIRWNRLPIDEYFLLIILTGLAGSFFDSFLGATIQLQNKCEVCSKITERQMHCGTGSKFYKGSRWINNDMVNFLSSVFGATLLFIIFNILNG